MSFRHSVDYKYIQFYCHWISVNQPTSLLPTAFDNPTVLTLPALLFKLVRRHDRPIRAIIRLVPYYATYRFSKLLCFAIMIIHTISPFCK